MTTQTEKLAIDGGQPCVVDKPASYLHGPQEIGEEEIAEVTAALRQKNLFRFGRAPETSPTAQFEIQFGRMTGSPHVLAVNSGTSALICAMVGLGVSTGDEVIVPAYTYIATAAAALSLHAIPVIADIDDTLTLDAADVERRITPRTRAIVAVHMRGLPCNMDALVAVARRHNLMLLEDCAQSNGGMYRGKALGSIGDAGAFSLQHYKIITAGEGGVFTARDKQVFDRGACYHDSAYAFWKQRNNELTIEPFLGENFRMSELNGALAVAQLRKRDRILSRLRALKTRLVDRIGDIASIRLQPLNDAEGDCSVSVVFYVDSPERAKRVAECLRTEGMSAGSMFDEGFPDRHIFYHWDYVMQKRTPDRHGYPWTIPGREGGIEYTKQMCPRTLHWLGRAVALPLTQVMSDTHIDSCATAIRKVCTGL